MAKERSPSYPSIGLTAAVTGVRQLFEKEKRTPVTLESIAKALGHTSLSGPATSKVSALRQYGLIEPASAGKYRISEDMLALVLPSKRPGDPEYDAALQKAALSPRLFAELFTAYPDASDDTLHYYLAKELHYSSDGATRVIKSYRDAISVAKLVPSSYTPPNQEHIEEEPVHLSPGLRARPSQTIQDVFSGDAPNFPLPDGLTGKILLSGAPTKKALLRLAQRVTEWAEDISEPEPDPRGSDEPGRLRGLETGSE